MNIIEWICLALLLFGLSVLISKGFDRQEKWECQKWQQQAENFEGFYWTDWQIEQCKDKITINL